MDELDHPRLRLVVESVRFPFHVILVLALGLRGRAEELAAAPDIARVPAKIRSMTI